jgi:tRNA modification GTPase
VDRTSKRKNPREDVIDEVLLTVMRAPKSYTKEDIIEINCHGGIQALKKVLELVLRRGARVAEPGEFTKRAFLNGRIDLVQAEAVLDTIRAKTESSLKAAEMQLNGELSKKVDGLRDELIDITSYVEASIDFPEEYSGTETSLTDRIRDVLKGLKDLISTAHEGMVLREGVLAIICGKPNVGKSSLMNLLLKRDRVIVSPIPGTTRDAVEETINLKGIPIRLVDTAGIAETKDALGKEGVRKSKIYLSAADIVIFVLDASKKWDGKDEEILKLIKGKKKIVVMNKVDLPRRIDAKALKQFFKGDRIVEISVNKRRNIRPLEKTIVETIWGGRYRQGEGALVTNARHKDLLDKAFGNVLSVSKAFGAGSSPELIAVDLREAVSNLGLIVGKSASDDILDRIFERFCIGK